MNNFFSGEYVTDISVIYGWLIARMTLTTSRGRSWSGGDPDAINDAPNLVMSAPAGGGLAYMAGGGVEEKTIFKFYFVDSMNFKDHVLNIIDRFV